MFSTTDEQLIRAALTLENQKKPLTTDAMTHTLSGKEKPGAEFIEDFVWYWRSIFDTAIHQGESRPPFPFQIVFLYILRHAPAQQISDREFAQVLGCEEALTAEGIKDWILGQTLKKRAATVVGFWRTNAERMGKAEEGRGEASLIAPMLTITKSISSREEEFDLYSQLRIMHLANIQARQYAVKQVEPSEVVHIAHEAADRVSRSSFPLLKHYAAFSGEDLRTMFEQEFRITLLGAPSLGQQEQAHLDQVVSLVRNHYRADPDWIAKQLGVDSRTAYTYAQLATKQIMSDPHLVAIRKRMESLEQQMHTREHVPETHELYCQYTKGRWMRVSSFHCDKRGVAINLENGKQCIFVEWTHVSNVEKMEHSLAWRPVPVIEASSADGQETLGEPDIKLEKVIQAIDSAPTISGWLEIGKALITGDAGSTASPTQESLSERTESMTLEAPEATPKDGMTTLESSEDQSHVAELVTLEYQSASTESELVTLERQDGQTPDPPALSDEDKLQKTLDALRRTADLSDEQLAEILHLRRPASARFWKLKARELLEQEQKSQQQEQPVAPKSSPRRLEQIATLPPLAAISQPRQDEIIRRATQQVEQWCREQSLKSGGKEDRLKSLKMYPCTSRLFLSGDRAWIAKTELVPAIGGYHQLFVAYRHGQFAIVPLANFVTSLATRLEEAWKQRGYHDASFMSWLHPSLEQIKHPQVKANASPHDQVWVASIRVAFQNASEVACIVWLHHAQDAIEIQVINTFPPVV